MFKSVMVMKQAVVCRTHFASSDL